MFIKSTVRGFASDIFNNLIAMSAMLVVTIFLTLYIDGHLYRVGLNSIWEANDILEFDSPFPFMAYAFKWIFYLLIMWGVYEIAHNVFYDARQTNRLTADGKNWSKIEKRKYTFPAARKTETAVINRVTEVEVSESTIDRILGTGTLRLTLTVFLNATEAQIKWEIPAVAHPHQIAANIRAKSLDHDGARVTTTLVPRGVTEV